jgi:hypothetical protein
MAPTFRSLALVAALATLSYTSAQGTSAGGCEEAEANSRAWATAYENALLELGTAKNTAAQCDMKLAAANAAAEEARALLQKRESWISPALGEAVVLHLGELSAAFDTHVVAHLPSLPGLDGLWASVQQLKARPAASWRPAHNSRSLRLYSGAPVRACRPRGSPAEPHGRAERQRRAGRAVCCAGPCGGLSCGPPPHLTRCYGKDKEGQEPEPACCQGAQVGIEGGFSGTYSLTAGLAISGSARCSAHHPCVGRVSFVRVVMACKKLM